MPLFSKKTQNNASIDASSHPNAKQVRLSILFTRLGEIDTLKENFSCEATLFATWRENVKMFENSYVPETNTYIWDSKNLWDPQLYVDNAIGEVIEKDVKFRLDKFYDDTNDEWYFEVQMIKRIQGTFFEKLELYHFPFDVQDLSITLTSHRTMDEILLVQDFGILAKMTKTASLDKHIWKLYDHVNIKVHTIRNDLPQSFDVSEEELESVCSHSAITMQCRVARKPGYFIINCLLPTLMITLCVFFTFMMDYARYHYRFSLLFTTMLTSITFRWAIHGRVLPTISYLTFLDVYCVSSILIVFGAMIWHAIYLVLYARSIELAQEWDLYAMLLFALIVLLVHIMQTIWFIIAMQKRTALEKLDRVCNFNYLKNRMTINNNNNGNITTTKRRRCNVIAGSSFIENSESKSAPQPLPSPSPASSPIRISCSLTKLDTHTNDSTNNMEHSALPNSKRRASSTKKTSRINTSLSRRSIAVAPKKSSKSLLLSSISNVKNDSIRNSFIQIKIEQQTEVDKSSSYMNKNVKSFIDLENESGESVGHDLNNNRKRSDEQHQQLMHSNGTTKFANYNPYIPLLYNPNTLSDQQQQH